MITIRWCSEVITHRSADHQSKRRPSARRMGGVNAVFGALLASGLVGRRLARLRHSLAKQVLQICAYLLRIKTGGRRRRGLVRCVHALTLSPAPAGCRINPANVSAKKALRRVSQARTRGKKSRAEFLENFANITPIAIKSIANLAKNHMVAKNNLSPLRQSRRNAKSPGTLGARARIGQGGEISNTLRRLPAPAISPDYGTLKGSRPGPARCLRRSAVRGPRCSTIRSPSPN